MCAQTAKVLSLRDIAPGRRLPDDPGFDGPLGARCALGSCDRIYFHAAGKSRPT
jgi:hypothetical protein